MGTCYHVEGEAQTQQAVMGCCGQRPGWYPVLEDWGKQAAQRGLGEANPDERLRARRVTASNFTILPKAGSDL